jgi:HEAT repeat protein
MFVSAALSMGLWLAVANLDAPLVTVPDPHAALKPETAEQRKARHASVAKTRAGTAIILHRAAWQYAPENTLSGIRAAAELGASGVELDFHRTLDGVIVLFHDEQLERLVDGIGRVDQYYYEELLLHTFNALPALAAETERVPTLRDLLEMLRSHALLVHLDIKVPGLDAEMLDEFRKADMLDHVAGFSDYNSEAFKKANITGLSWKGALMGHDTDPREAAAVLKHPGNGLMMDDARATLTALGKPPVRITPQPWAPLGEASPPALDALEAVLRGTSKQMPVRLAAVRLTIYAPRRFAELAGELCQCPNAEVRRATAWNLGMIAKHRPQLVSDAVRAALLRLLNDPDTSVRAEAGVACGRAKIQAAVPTLVKLLTDRPADDDRGTEDKKLAAERQTVIEARAHYAFALGLLGVKNPAATRVLVDAMKHRAAVPDMMLAGFDGAMAASALGKLRAAEAVGDMRSVLFHETPALAKFMRPTKPVAESAHAFMSLDLRTRAAIISDFRMWSAILPALAEIGSDESLAVLDAIIDSPEKDASESQSYLRGEAAEALMNFRGHDFLPILSRLMTHRVPQVRRFAILACLKKADPRYRKLLESAAPWATAWWDVQYRPKGQ